MEISFKYIITNCNKNVSRGFTLLLKRQMSTFSYVLVFHDLNHKVRSINSIYIAMTSDAMTSEEAIEVTRNIAISRYHYAAIAHNFTRC